MWGVRFARSLLASSGMLLLTAGGAAQTPQPEPAEGQKRCSALIGLSVPGIGRITTAARGAAALPPGPYGQPAIALPPHCEITAVMQERTGRLGQRYAIHYHLRMPDEWNGRLLFQGGGGSNGDIGNAVGAAHTAGPPALVRGFAVVSQDSGHENAVNVDPRWGGTTVFGTDPLARANYGHASIPLVTAAAKTVLARYYGRAAQHSYFLGCSKGGQEGMAAAQRYPRLFDGIVAAAPGFALPRAALNEAYSVQQFAALARKTTGQPATVGAIGQLFTAAQMQLVRKAVLEVCDASDGLADGITADFRQCSSAKVMAQLRASACHTGAANACLSLDQVDTLGRVMAGPQGAKGRPIYAPWTWDGGVGSPMWAMWRTGNEQVPAFDIALGGASLATVFSVPPLPVSPQPDAVLALQIAYRFPAAERMIYRRAAPFTRSAWADIGMHSANLDAFFAHGGKLLVPHGVADPVFSIMDTLGWWDRVKARYGAKTDASLRVMPVPGMAHCAGGPATTHYDILAAMTDWVEKDKAPDAVIATADAATPWPGRTRPLCSWPAIARYRGGDPEKAESFACVK